MKCLKCGNKIDNDNYCKICKTYNKYEKIDDFKKTFHESIKDIPARIDMEENDLLILKKGKFRVEKQLGRGGFGSVYKIKNSENDEYAIKILDLWRIKPNEHESLIKRFSLEYKTGLIKSDNIVNSYGKGNLEGNPYIIMELCENGTLEERLLEFYNENDFKQLALQILNGLKSLHDLNLIHRDIKPENIIFKNNTAKLTDFGITGDLKNRMTKVNWLGAAKEIWGTPLYSAPEQKNRKGSIKKAGPQMDIFSFGVTMFEVISGGKLPFASTEEINNTPLIYEKRVNNGQYSDINKYRKDISSIWSMILNKSLKPNPIDRYQSVNEIILLINSIKNTAKGQIVDHLHNIDLNIFDKIQANKGDFILALFDNKKLIKYYNLSKILHSKNNTLLTIGRFDDTILNKNDISISDRIGLHISRKQATLEYENKQWYIRDGQWDKRKGWKKSKNGTYVNDERVDEYNGKKVEEGDAIFFGQTKYKLLLY